MGERRRHGHGGVFFVVLSIFMFLPSLKPHHFIPADNYLINCGSPQSTLLDDGRIFKSDPQSLSYLSTDETILASTNSISSLPLYQTARIFHHESMYRFLVFKPGPHWLRFYFHPIPHPSYNLTKSMFSVTANDIVLLHDFSVKDSEIVVFKEYLVNISSAQFTLKFSPLKNSVAFINALELVSAPDDLIPDSATAVVSPGGDFNALKEHTFEVVYRVNVGGPALTPKNDTMGRTWVSDDKFMTFPQGAKIVSVSPKTIEYRAGGVTDLVAPNWVYATGDRMMDSGVADPNFNLTWEVKVDPNFSYFIRLHFCDIVSKSLNELYFNVYFNGILGVSNLDLSTLTSGLAIPYYKDFVLNATAVWNSTIAIQVGPTSNLQTNLPNAILNGFEILKMSNSDGSLDGLFSSGDVKYGGLIPRSNGLRILASIGLAMGLIALVFGVVRWHRRPNKGWEKQKTFSSWLLPLNASYCSFMSSKSKMSNHSTIFSSGLEFGKIFTFNEIKKATKNFDEKAVIGVGGFGKVYLGELEDGTKLAIKRGNPSSSQGITEFQTEIQMLSKLRHRHLVSLIGYCDEQSEMILVYEYMSNGPLRDHIYGSSDTGPPLSWRQRLEICIGAARGLHYLHTGSAQGMIIHRDVKTTNILLDDNLVAKMADFGLSKAGPASLDQTHVSTAVKGSFGYLDPEYFRRQQLTEKSDVYSFGVVLFEVLCGRAALDPALPREQVNLAEWAMQKHRKGEIRKIIHPNIEGTISEESLRKYVEAAEKCLAEYGVDRPSMGDVLSNLEYALQLQDSSSSQEHKKLMIDITDDSGVVVASPIFNDNIHGR